MQLFFSSIEDAMFDRMEEKRNESFAELLGITLGELEMLDYNENELTTDDHVYAVEFTFHENSPKEILGKIKGLDQDNSIVFDTGTLGYYSY